jgi:hypothetical protein
VSVELSPELEQELGRLFPGEAASQAREILRPEQSDRVLLAVLALSEGDLERLQHFSDLASADFRDVLSWAEQPPDDDEPRSYEELRQRLGPPPETGDPPHET